MTTVGEDRLTRLSEEEQQAILYWTETIGVPVFPADTRNKGLYIKGWSEINFASIDYKANLFLVEEVLLLQVLMVILIDAL